MNDLKIIQSSNKHITVGNKWKRWIQSDTDSDTEVGTFMDTNLNIDKNGVLLVIDIYLLESIVFAPSDTTATIYFIMQFCVASIRERRLIK